MYPINPDTPTAITMDIQDGAHYYNPFVLLIYDVWVLKLNMRYAWRSPTDTILLPLFEEAFVQSNRHLDIGVASGFFPSTALSRKRSRGVRGDQRQEIILMDLNPGALLTAKARIERDNPGDFARIGMVVGDALGAVPEGLQGRKFDSVSLFNLIHCFPPGTERKTRVFGLAAEVLSDEGVVVGSTVLGRGYIGWNLVSWFWMFWFNVTGAFGNWGDEPGGLEEGLRREFGEVETWIVGQSFLFRASKPRRRPVEGKKTG